MPIAIQCQGCGRSYTLNDRFGGHTVKCKQCGGPIAVPDNQPFASSADWLVNEVPQHAAGKSYSAPATSPLGPAPHVHSKAKKSGLVSWQSAVVAAFCLVGIIALAAGRLGVANLATAAILIAAGIFSISGAAYDWDWFINHYKARLFLRIFGRTNTRVLYGVLGMGVFLGGVSIAVGLINAEPRRKRFAWVQPARQPSPSVGHAASAPTVLTGKFSDDVSTSGKLTAVPPPSAMRSSPVASSSANHEETNSVSSGADTQILGGTFDPVYKDQIPDGGHLIGFEVGSKPAFGSVVISTVRPIFRTAQGDEVAGEMHGTDATNVARATAKEGYAVGGIIVKSGLCIAGFSIVFMRVTGDRLDPSDSYESEWFGGLSGNDKIKLGAQGGHVVALLSKSNGIQCTGIGLSIKD